VESVGCHAVDI